MNLEQREKQITKTSIVGIVANVFLVAFKAFVGFIAGSISIILDAVNNLTDMISSVVTIIGVKLAKQKPDEKHPFGHGRIEYFSAIIVAGIILAAGIMSIIESVKKIFVPEMPEYSWMTITIVSVAIVVKLVLGRYVTSRGKKLNSEALAASGADATFDAIISAATLVGIIVAMVFKFSVDGYIGAAISAFIIKAGIEMLLQSVGNVMGHRPDAGVTKGIKEEVRSIDKVLGAYDLVLHDYGPNYAMGSVHVEIPADMSAAEIHTLTQEIIERIEDKFHVFLTVGIYAVDEVHAPQREAIRELALKHEGVLGTHGVYISDERKFLSLDVLIDFNVRDANALKETLAEEFKTVLPGYEVAISFDTNYSD